MWPVYSRKVFTSTNSSYLAFHLFPRRCEPYELVEITVPDEHSSAVVDMLNRRKGEMQLMGSAEGSEGWQALSYLIPTRGEKEV